MAQTKMPYDVVLVDDMAGITPTDLAPLIQSGDEVLVDDTAKYSIRVVAPDGHDFVRVWRSPWRLGIPGCANVGIALGQTDMVFQFSCDDKMLPNCLAECWAEWERRKDPLGYYWVGIQYSTGEKQSLACGHALVPKALWRHTGGFPPETGVGGCDAAFISMMLSHRDAGTLYGVAGGAPLYWHREHDEQYTKHQNAHPGSILDVRKVFGDRWRPVAEDPWGRMVP